MVLTLISGDAPSVDESGRNSCRIAVVPSMGLGDSLIYLVIANNLARAGYRVTMLSNHLAHFAPWLPDLEMLPFPEVEDTLGIADAYDLVMSDCGSIVTSAASDKARLAERFVFVGTLRVDTAYVHDHLPRLKQRVGADKASVMSRIATCAGPMRVLNDDSVSMVDQAVAFCQLKLGLGNASADPGFVMPHTLIPRRHPFRVMLHPTSYNEKKNWPHQKYLNLARRLRLNGYDPQFVISPKEFALWAPRLGEEFPIPRFANACELAAYLYESGYVVGNDSGVGHLASALGVPVLTLFRKRRDGFCWRPGWGRNVVVRPVISVGAFRNSWKRFLSVGRVEKAFMLLARHHRNVS